MNLNIRWSKVLIATTSMAGILLVAFLVPVVIGRARESRASQLYPHPASDLEQTEILRAVLEDKFWLEYQSFDREPRNPFSLVLLDTSAVFCGNANPEAPDHSSSIDEYRLRWRTCITSEDTQWASSFVQDEKIERSLLRELVAANQAPAILPDPHSATILFRPQDSLAGLFHSPNQWEGFHALFPHSAGAIKVSRAVLSKGRKHALIYVRILILYFHAADQDVVYYLVRTRGGWRVEKASGPQTT